MTLFVLLPPIVCVQVWFYSVRIGDLGFVEEQQKMWLGEEEKKAVFLVA
jgi:hypothetical protein